MKMKLILREMTWHHDEGPTVIVRAFGDQVTATIHEDGPFLGRGKNTMTEHRSWDEATAHAEKVVGQPLHDEHAVGHETWSDGIVKHAVAKNLTVRQGGGSWTYSCVVSTVLVDPQVSIRKDRLATRDDAIRIGRDFIPIVHAALKATQAGVPAAHKG